MKKLIIIILTVLPLFVQAQGVYTFEFFYIPWDVKFRDSYTAEELRTGKGTTYFVDTISPDKVDSLINSLNNLKVIRPIPSIDPRMLVVVKINEKELLSFQLNRTKAVFYKESLFHKDEFISYLIEKLPVANREHWDR